MDVEEIGCDHAAADPLRSRRCSPQLRLGPRAWSPGRWRSTISPRPPSPSSHRLRDRRARGASRIHTRPWRDGSGRPERSSSRSPSMQVDRGERPLTPLSPRAARGTPAATTGSGSPRAICSSTACLARRQPLGPPQRPLMLRVVTTTPPTIGVVAGGSPPSPRCPATSPFGRAACGPRSRSPPLRAPAMRGSVRPRLGRCARSSGCTRSTGSSTAGPELRAS
jgi:hypothetical protein